MVTIGNHLKMTVTSALKARTREFYGGLLGLKPIPSPAENLDLYEFSGGFVLGLFFSDNRAAKVRRDRDCIRRSVALCGTLPPLLLPGTRRPGVPPRAAIKENE